MLDLIVVDDHPIVRRGLESTLSSHPDIRITGLCATALEAMAALRQKPCDVLLLDVSLPDLPGFEVLKRARMHHPEVRVLMLSGFPESAYGLSAIRSGARGYVSKDACDDELLHAIRVVGAGDLYMPPGLAALLIEPLQAGKTPPHLQLEEREFEIFCYLARGLTVGPIASTLRITAKTVGTYRERILRKLKVRRVADLTAYALQHRLMH